MLNFWNKVVYELDCYQKVFVAIVVNHQKGSPGTNRAQWLCTEAAEVMGTIGGGVMESQLLKEATALLKKGHHIPTVRTLYHRNSDETHSSGLICGGAQPIVTMVLDHAHRPVLHELVKRLRYNEPGVLVMSPSGLRLEEEDLSRPSMILEDSGGNWTVRFGLFNRRRILVVGCGHCGAALGRQIHLLGFQVNLVEPRENLSTSLDLPARVNLLQKPFSDAGRGLKHARLTFAVVMTPSYPDDVDALASLLPEAFPFIGVMGSPAKLQKIKKELQSRGFGESGWNRLSAPVGLPIESDTPAEIAVSIAAQILQKTNQFSF
jgi:xanthine dehydrogenase accessory factor